MSAIPPLYPVSEGQSLEDCIQGLVAGISGLDGTMVRQRWQPEPPNIPDYGKDWAALGITRRRPVGTYPWVGHHPDGDGYDEMQRHEQIDILISFYGPGADLYSQNLHNGLMIWQNYSVLLLVGMAFIELTESIRAPEFIKERWWERVDKTLVLRRIIRRTYPVLNLLSASGVVITDPGQYQVPFTAPWPTGPTTVQAVGQAFGAGFAMSTSAPVAASGAYAAAIGAGLGASISGPMGYAAGVSIATATTAAIVSAAGLAEATSG